MGEPIAEPKGASKGDPNPPIEASPAPAGCCIPMPCAAMPASDGYCGYAGG